MLYNFMGANKKKKKKDRTLEEEDSVNSSNPFNINQDEIPQPEVRTIIKVVKKKSDSKYSGGSNGKWKKIILAVGIIAVASASCFFIYINHQKKTVGIQAVMDMYNYNNLNQLNDQMKNLQSITTPEIYNRITVTNYNTALSTYLKFKQSPVKVNIINSGKGWVIYSLTSPYIAPSRHFVLLYKTNWLGKINYTRQEEAIDFFNYSN